MKDKYGYVYVCFYNDKPYIGQRTGLFNKRYYGSGKKWNNVIKNIDKSTIKRIVLDYCDTFEELNEREKYWIEHYDSIKNGYNIHNGGCANVHMMRNNLSFIMKTVMADESRHVKQKISNTLKEYRKNNPFSESHRRRLSEAMKGRNHFGGAYYDCSIAVYCLFNNKYYNFKSKRDAAAWWYKTYPFSDIFAEITYTRNITRSIKKEKIFYKRKEIRNINWFLGVYDGNKNKN